MCFSTRVSKRAIVFLGPKPEKYALAFVDLFEPSIINILSIEALFLLEQETVCKFNKKPFALEFYIIKNKSINKTIT